MMKRSFTILACLAFVFAVNAQITLTEMNTPHSSSYEDVRRIDMIGVAIPVHGANVMYNYELLPGVERDTIPYIPATRPDFTSFTRFSYGSAPLGGIPLFSEYYTQVTSGGIARMGSFKLPQKVGLELLTGNTQDTLAFPGNNTLFVEPAYEVKFPTTYGDNWVSNFVFQTDFVLSVAAFGLSNVPGAQTQYVEKRDSVVGWGTLVLPSGNGGSIPYDVLLIKQQRIVVDSVFLGGAPAPPVLLGAFGLTQGGQSQLNRYFFYAEGFEKPLMAINMSEDWQTVERSFYAVNDILISGIKSPTLIPQVDVFPNPTTASSLVHFGLEDEMNKPLLMVYNVLGEQIHREVLEGGQGRRLQWKTPVDMQNGAYFFTLTDQENNAVYSGRLIIQ